MRLALYLFLLASAPALAIDRSTEPRSSEPVKDKLVCKREVPIGSLIASRKMCLTKTEWRKRTDDGNATARRLIEDGTSRCGQGDTGCSF